MPPGGRCFGFRPTSKTALRRAWCFNDQSLDNHIPQSDWQKYGQPIWQNLVSDERNFYSCCSLEWLAAGVGGAAILANTNLDQQFRQFVHGEGGTDPPI